MKFQEDFRFHLSPLDTPCPPFRESVGDKFVNILLFSGSLFMLWFKKKESQSEYRKNFCIQIDFMSYIFQQNLAAIICLPIEKIYC